MPVAPPPAGGQGLGNNQTYSQASPQASWGGSPSLWNPTTLGRDVNVNMPIFQEPGGPNQGQVSTAVHDSVLSGLSPDYDSTGALAKWHPDMMNNLTLHSSVGGFGTYDPTSTTSLNPPPPPAPAQASSPQSSTPSGYNPNATFSTYNPNTFTSSNIPWNAGQVYNQMNAWGQQPLGYQANGFPYYSPQANQMFMANEGFGVPTYASVAQSTAGPNGQPIPMGPPPAAGQPYPYSNPFQAPILGIGGTQDQMNSIQQSPWYQWNQANLTPQNQPWSPYNTQGYQNINRG